MSTPFVAVLMDSNSDLSVLEKPLQERAANAEGVIADDAELQKTL